MCCPLDCDPNLKPGDPLPCPECRDDYKPHWTKMTEEPVTWEYKATGWIMLGFFIGMAVTCFVVFVLGLR